MTEETITDLDGLPDALGEEWSQGKRLFFRGQSQNWPLIPSLGRRYQGTSFFDIEKRLFDEFKKEYIQRYGHPKDSDEDAWREGDCDRYDWDWIFAAIAQHHGVPTRLLDWSTNVKKALLFSVVNDNDADRGSDGVLYGFHDRTAITLKSGVPCFTQDDSPFRIQNVRPFTARGHGLNLDRIKAQEGVFTFQPDPTNDLIAELELGKIPEQKWRKWRIPRGAKTKLRCQLAKEQITLAAMFPGIDGLCRHVCHNVFGC